MKVIDLLNKIAKGEEAPKKIRFDCTYWEKVCGEKYPYYIDDCDNDLFIYFFRKNLTFTLNDEVEIIEEVEDKEYEDIEETTGDYIVPNTPATENEAYIMACLIAHEQTLNALIRNQNKIIERMKENE